MYGYFVACAPGLESWLARELADLGLNEPSKALAAEPGGVRFCGVPRDAAVVCLHSGLANHLRLRVGQPFEVRHFDRLVRQTAALPWGDLLRPRTRVKVHAVCRKSRLYHSTAVEERVRAGVERAIGSPAAGADGGCEGAVEVVVRLVRDRCVVSVDLGGEPLHRRGWRQRTAKAPLREDLARALLLASGWRRGQPLLDPLMGAGTILIEAATMARRLAPGLGRSFALEQTALAEASTLAELRARAREAALPGPGGLLVGRDRQRGALEAAVSNAVRAGVRDDLDLGRGELADAAWPPLPGGVVVTNPPYGVRVEAREGLSALYEALGQRVRHAQADLGVVVADRRWVRMLHAPAQPRLRTDHGGIGVEFFSTAKPQRSASEGQEKP